MSCVLNQGYTIACGEFQKAGGVANIYLANKEDVTSITKSTPTGEYDTITMAVGKVWYKIDASKNSASVVQTFDGAGFTNKQTLVFALPTYSQIVKELYGELAFAKVYAIVETRDGKRMLLGLNTSGLEAETIETNTGSAVADANRTTFTLSILGEVIETFSTTATIPLV
jgi:hypothetical protein